MKPFSRSLPSKISICVSDLSVRGAGRWGDAVRPFLLGRALQKAGFEVEIVGFVFGEENPTLSSDIPLVTFTGEQYPGFLRPASQLWSRLDGDILYAYKLKPTSLGIALLRKQLTRRPVLLDIDDWELSWHGGDAWQYHPSWKQLARDILKPNGALRNPHHPLYLKWTEKWVSQADAVTTHNQFLQKRFGGIYLPQGKDTVHFAPDGYNAPECRRQLGLSDYRVLMFPGAPRPYKGVEDVLQALDILDEPDLRLAIVGGSPYDDYDRYLMTNWSRWIVKIAPQPVAKMPAVVAAAHVIVVPQRDTEATRAQFPLKLTDGMAMAKPILATRVGDIPQILENTGYLVDPHSPPQLARGIQEIFQNWEAASDRGRQARERCVRSYSLEAMADILSEVVTQVAAKGNHGKG
ncbi:glycosyltransferase [Geitlerinema sp. PCC 9228]|uniref:glycosyltransferase n=1 Tax=Geitlerinema sp. PCC 9228 TaxID=111611 RepID=UPI0008F9C648|nr:glycosyltransferase [Geitlerinema sp. PCC 9228]